MTYVGIDLHSNNMVIVTINGNGEVIREAKLPTSRRSLEDFFSTFGGPVKAVVECTSNWYWLSDWCRANDVELTRGRLRLIRWRGKLQSALWGQAIKYNGKINGSQWRELKKLQQWLQPQLPSAARLQAQLLIGQMSQLQQHIHRVEEEIEKQLPFEVSAERLMAVPGLGKVGAWTVLAEIGDIRRFPSAKQFVSYCRLVPGAKDSGGNRKHQSGNKDGNKYLRAAFGQAAVSAYTHYKVVKKFYRKIKRRSGRPVARAVVAKELAKGVWYMLTRNQEYKGFKGQPVRAASQTCWPQPISPFA